MTSLSACTVSDQQAAVGAVTHAPGVSHTSDFFVSLGGVALSARKSGSPL